MKRLIKQLFDFAIVGVIATVIDYLLFVLFFNVMTLHYLVATVLAFVGATIFNYWASMTYVFKSKYEGKEKRKEFIIFLTLSIMGLILTTLLMKLTVDGLGIHANIAKILVTGLVMIFNFITRKIFLEDRNSDPHPVEKAEPKRCQGNEEVHD